MFVRTQQATYHFGVSLHDFPTTPCVYPAKKAGTFWETLTNLLYLTEMEADDPQKVRAYLSLFKERVQAMTELLSGKGDGGNPAIVILRDSLRS